MLTKERCAYPKKLFYKTWIARHRTAYWITLDNIQRGAKVAEIQAEVEGNAIQIHTVGTDGLKIQIPPYLREYKDICVSINEHKRMLAVEDLPTEIHITISDTGWEMTTESVPFSAKGTGLLDVYCNPVRVLYNSGNLQSIADVFAHPMCTGFNAKDQRVLLISSNNWVVFKKFLFFRHLILPTYLNGPQPFLNNEVLLLTRHGIYAAYENGGEMTKM